MNPLIQNYHSAILYELKAEIQKHHLNFQRALDGTNYSYVPTSTQRDKIKDEQTRLDSIMIGIAALEKLWGITGPLRKSSKGLTASNYDDIRAASSLAYMQADACKTKNVHPTYTTQELAGLKELFIYVDCKLDSRVLPPEERYEYSTMGTDTGYTLSSEKFHYTS